MLRWTLVVLALASCDKGPIQEHRIHYEMGGLGDHGPLTWRIDVDLDKRTLVSSTDKVTQHALSEADAKLLRDLASCARDEGPGPKPGVHDEYTRILLDGDKARDITQGGPMTAPCAAKLQRGLEVLAAWHE